ncbi:MAG: hypothetical protein ACLPX9_12020 [Rhodomicrobium sp.]
MVRKTISIALVASLAATSAQAALLTNVEGGVSVDRGYGFAPAGASSVIAPGVRIRTGEGSADIVYENGCTVKVAPGQTVIVLGSPPPCREAAGAPAGGVSENALYLGGALAVGGGAAAAILLTQSNSSSRPASP